MLLKTAALIYLTCTRRHYNTENIFTSQIKLVYDHIKLTYLPLLYAKTNIYLKSLN